jgi:hypothetical protein
MWSPELSPFIITWKIVDIAWNFSGSRSTTVGDVSAATASMMEFSKSNAPLYNGYRSNMQNGTYVIAFWQDRKVYLKDTRPWWRAVLMSDLCNNKDNLV